MKRPTHPSLGQLLSLQGSLAPVRAKTNVVATPPPPPPLYRYGQQERGAPQNSQYTGGTVQSPYRPIENINTEFVSPTYARAPLAAAGGASAFPALAAILGVGHGFPGSPGGTPPRPPLTGTTPSLTPRGGTTSSPAGAPGSSGGYTPRIGKATGGTALGGYGGTYRPYNPQPSTSTPASAGNPTGGYSGGYVPLGTQLASAALRGRRGTYYE